MWVFALTSDIIPNALVAGRIVGVLFGYMTLLGVWKISRYLGTTQIAVLSSLLFITIPLFSFYDRQALMESAIGAVGIWGCYLTLRIIKNANISTYIMLGLLYGLGFLIKLNALIFIVPSFILITTSTYIKNNRVLRVVIGLCIFILTFYITSWPLLFQNEFWRTLSTNNLFTLTSKELSSLPIQLWATSFRNSLEIIFFHVTPFVLLATILFVIDTFRNKHYKYLPLIIWFLLTICIIVLIARNVTERYLVSFLPPLVIFASIQLIQMYRNLKNSLFIVLTVLAAAALTIIQITSPVFYHKTLSAFTRFSFNEYFSGFPSGYGVPEAVSMLQRYSAGKNIYVTFGVHTGNPENGVMVALRRNTFNK